MRCIVCNHTKFLSLYKGLLLKCKNCGHIAASILNKHINVKKIYSEEYFSGLEYYDYKKDQRLIEKNFRNHLIFIKTLRFENFCSSTLEIGCAYGFFGNILKQIIPLAEDTGIDITTPPCRFAASEFNLNTQCCDYLNFKSTEHYSDVFMWDVIEHLENPQKYIAKINNDLQPGGRLLITTGDISSFLASVQGIKWRMIHPPTHLHYFSKQSISRLLLNYNYKIISITYPSVWRSLRQIFYSSFILNKKENSIMQSILNMIPPRLALYLNTKDIMLVIAEKN